MACGEQSDPLKVVRLPGWSRDMLDDYTNELDRTFRDCGVSLAYVFGSMARGREADRKAISDMDIAVVFPESMPRSEMKDAWYRLRDALEHVFCREDFDLVVANDASAALRYRIIRDRDLIYCSSEQELALFECKARREWHDMSHFRKMQRRSLEAHYGVDDR